MIVELKIISSLHVTTTPSDPFRPIHHSHLVRLRLHSAPSCRTRGHRRTQGNRHRSHQDHRRRSQGACPQRGHRRQGLETTTGPDGVYSLALPAGRYNVQCVEPGFQTAKRPAVELAAGATLPLDIQLPLEEQTESVNVTGEVPTIDTTTRRWANPSPSKR